MKHRILSCLIIIFGLLVSFTSKEKSSREFDKQVANLVAFTKVYGFVKYFHPSDEASSIDWEAFARFGTSKILNTPSEIAPESLDSLFNPLGPAIRFGDDNDARLLYQPKKEQTKKIVFWQHSGLGISGRLLNTLQDGIFQSVRINRRG